MLKIIKAEIVRPGEKGERFFVSLSYGDNNVKEFKIIRGSISWPRDGIPGLILVGGIVRRAETIRVVEEVPFNTLPEARNIMDRFAGVYSRALYCVYYQDTPESEGYIKHLTGGDQYRKPPFSVAPYTGNIDYTIQLVNSSLADNKLQVPGNGVLATQLLTGKDNINSGRELHGVIALSCLISGMEARFDGAFSEDTLEGLRDFPPNERGADSDD